MRLSLRTKILGSFAFIVLLSLALAVGLSNRANEIRYDRYLALQDYNRATVLARVMGPWTAEAVDGDSDGFEIVTEHPFQMFTPGDLKIARDLYTNRRNDGFVGGVMDRMDGGKDRIGPEGPGIESLVITDMEGNILLDNFGYGEETLEVGTVEGVLVRHDNRDVGYLYLSSMIPGHPRPRDLNYLQTAGRLTWIITTGVFILAMILGILLTRHIIRPMKVLNRATTEVKAGDLSVRIPDTREDELGDLSRGFNAMTSSLETADRQRRRLIADSAHELRTPISLIRARIEMMEEGVYPMDAGSLAALAGESDRLVKLVEELRILADLESPETEPVKTDFPASSMLEAVLDALSPAAQQAGVGIGLEVSGELPRMHADSGQLHRLFSNLLNNALRYAETQVVLAAEFVDGTGESGPQLRFRVEDDGPGIPEDARDRIFDRYFRVDSSRSRDSGGSGLGLAICMEIARSHGGFISAGVSEKLGGASLEVLIPC